jgi:hypothetical protein
LAGLLHVADLALSGEVPETISGATFERATKLGDYFLAHAVAAFQAMGVDEETELAKRIWAWARRQGQREFSEGEATRASHAKPEASRDALTKLIERRLIRPLPDQPTGGRPSRRFEVRP